MLYFDLLEAVRFTSLELVAVIVIPGTAVPVALFSARRATYEVEENTGALSVDCSVIVIFSAVELFGSLMGMYDELTTITACNCKKPNGNQHTIA